MSEPAPGQRPFPDHVNEAVRSIAELHSEHRGRATASQRLAGRISSVIARPVFLAVLILAVAFWIGANLAATALGAQAIDPPDFPALQGAAGLFSLFIVMLVLVAQRHEDQLNARREILTLEIAMLGERKIAKVIELLEELRRDSPHVADRIDRQADQMSQPADAKSVLAAVRDAAP